MNSELDLRAKILQKPRMRERAVFRVKPWSSRARLESHEPQMSEASLCARENRDTFTRQRDEEAHIENARRVPQETHVRQASRAVKETRRVVTRQSSIENRMI